MVSGIAGSVVFGALLVAGVRKLRRPDDWHRLLRQYGFPRKARLVSFLSVPWVEVSIALTGVLAAARIAAVAAAVLLVAFSMALLRLRRLAGTDRLPCGCFGDEVQRDYRRLLARNAALAALAAAVAADAPSGGLIDPDGVVGAMVAVVTGAGALVWCSRQAQRARRRRSVVPI